jgi:hypothetical protein
MSSKLDAFIEKQLLEDIEGTGKLRSDISLLSICNSSISVYGKPGSDRRRLVQKRFDNLNRLTIKQWSSYLDQFEVSHGLATARELWRPEPRRQQEPPADPEPETTSAAEDTVSLAVSLGTTSMVETTSAEDTVSLASAFSNISLGTTSIPPLPPAKQPSLFSTPPRTPARPRAMMSPDTAASAASWNSAGDSTVAGSSHEGSKINPYVINVDVEHPERNREFDIEFVQQIKHNNYIRSGYHIRVNVGVKDLDLWQAKMVQQGEGFENRAILVKGPSRPFWMNCTLEYHRKLTCDSTKDAHLASVDEIKQDAERQFSYWMLVFPKSVTLDNAVFSGDPVNIEAERVGLKLDQDGVDFNTCIVFWKVADNKFRGRRVEEKKKNSVTDMFA